MDRFIELENVATHIVTIDLKSSMDRFIAPATLKTFVCDLHLKSSMDRFIEGHKHTENLWGLI